MGGLSCCQKDNEQRLGKCGAISNAHNSAVSHKGGIERQRRVTLWTGRPCQTFGNLFRSSRQRASQRLYFKTLDG